MVPKVIGGGAQQSPHLISNLINSPILARKAKLVDELTNGLKMRFRLIPAGTFIMGSPKSEKGRYKDEERHAVEISRPFYLGVHTVTVGQFKEFVRSTDHRTEAEKDDLLTWGYNSSKLKFERRSRKAPPGLPRASYNWLRVGWKQTDRHPVVNVSWNDAVAFCAWLSKQEGQTYRLPTEAEWEYACRAGTSTPFHCGDATIALKGYANVRDRALKAKLHADYSKKWVFVIWNDGHPFTAPVGSYKPNAWGLYDMHGNVWQWCSDRYQKDYHKDKKRDPQGPLLGAYRVIRGGSFNNDVLKDCRAAARGAYTSAFRDINCGFRVVCIPADGTR
jgi:formylglycine-generating enzyme required for sulfatase activity